MCADLAPNAKESSRESSRETRFFRRAELCAGGGSGPSEVRAGRGASEITEARDGRGSQAGKWACWAVEEEREEAGGRDLDGHGLTRTAGKGALTGHDLCREEVGGHQSCRFFTSFTFVSATL